MSFPFWMDVPARHHTMNRKSRKHPYPPSPDCPAFFYRVNLPMKWACVLVKKFITEKLRKLHSIPFSCSVHDKASGESPYLKRIAQHAHRVHSNLLHIIHFAFQRQRQRDTNKNDKETRKNVQVHRRFSALWEHTSNSWQRKIFPKRAFTNDTKNEFWYQSTISWRKYINFNNTTWCWCWLVGMHSIVHRPIPITRFLPGLPLNPTSNKHWPIWIARGRSSEQESACFQARILPVISETKVLVWLEKRSSCHGNRELSILLYTLVLTSVWLKASSDLEKNFFQSKLCPRSIWYGVWFPIRNLEGQKNARWKYRNLPLPSIHWHAHSPLITHFLLPGLSSPEFLVFISGFLCFFLFLFRSQISASILSLVSVSICIF